MRALGGIEGSVFLDEDEASALFSRAPAARSSENVLPFPGPRRAKVSLAGHDVLDYCVDLIRGAEGDEGHREACHVARQLLIGVGLTEEAEALSRNLAPSPEATDR